MKKYVLAALTAVISLGAVAPAMAWNYNHCVAAGDFGASSGTLANHCKQFIPSDGLISFGSHKNELWEDVFPDVHFGKEVVRIEDYGKLDESWLSSGYFPRYIHTHIWEVKGNNDAIKTKKLDNKGWEQYITQHAKSKYPVVHTGDQPK